MDRIRMPYGSSELWLNPDELNVKAVLSPGGESVTGQKNISEVLGAPIGSKRLCELAKGKKRLLVITSDHTRPLPSRETLPLLLAEARKNEPDLEVKILIATGCHRGMTKAEMLDRFGPELTEQEDIQNHDAFDSAQMVRKGVLPSGGALYLNRLVDWAELVVAEGFIEPHFFAGFSGGRKSILPGIASRDTVYYNHCAQFIASPASRTGNLEGNPIHRDMVYASGRAKLAFILNVVLGHDKKIISAFAGDPEQAHAEGCAYVKSTFRARPVPAEIVITTNGGYPLDQNLYQAVKGLTAAEQCVKKGGIIVMLAECVDGHGGEGFYKWFADRRPPAQILADIAATPPEKTRPDQWQAQILARILCKSTVIFVTRHCNQALVENMGMRFAPDLKSAAVLAKGLAGSDACCTVIPDGVGIIVE